MGTITNFAGMYTDPNLINLPPGAVREAQNVVSDRPGTAECRMGQVQLGAGYETSSERLVAATLYGENSVEQTTTSLYSRALDGTVSQVASGIFPAESGGRMRFAVAGDDLYMASSDGVQVMDGPNGTPATPGVPPAPDSEMLYVNSWGFSTPMYAPGASAAYRWVFVRYDNEGREVIGAPSGRIVVTNTDATAKDLQLVIPIPSDLEYPAQLRVYRTNFAAGEIDPGDTMFQAAEFTFASAPGPTWGFVDRQPDILLGAPLYTNNTSVLGGITMANERAPLAQDLAYFRQSLFAANTTARAVLSIRLLGLPADNTTVTIAGIPYVGRRFSSGIGADFIIDDQGSLSVSKQIEITARNLLRAVNINLDSPVTLSYVSGPNDPPGMLAIRAKDVTAPAFTMSASGSGAVFEPPLTSALTAFVDRRPNGIDVSKAGLPYAFPSDSAYHLRLGRADKRILRLMVNRDSLFAFKEDGIWIIYPSGATYGYRQISTDVVLQYPDSVAVLDNQIFAFTNRGIVAVDESGIEEVDGPVKNFVAAIRDATLSTAKRSVFAVADPVRLRYYLFYSDGSSGTMSQQALVYNGKTDTWTERDDSTTGGYIGADGLLYLGQGGSKYVRRDRNTGTVSDYASPAGDAIHAVIEWAAVISENPSGASQFTEIHLLTEEATEGPYTFTFTSHYNESETCQPEGENLPEVRIWVPNGVQRTTRLRIRMERDVFEESFVVLGITNSARYYRGPATRA